MITAQPPLFWWSAIRRGVAFWIGVRGLFYAADGYTPSLFGTLLTLAVVGVLCSVQIVAMRERVFLANAGLDKLPVLVALLAATPLEITLAVIAQAQ